MGFISDIASGLGRGSKFEKDWYGYLSNQFSHVGLGIFGAWISCLFAFLISGDLPYRWQVFTAIAAVYVVKEFLSDKWQGSDTIEDFLFVVVYGVGGTLTAFKQIDPSSSDIIFSLFDALPFLCVCLVHLVVGMFLRWKDLRDE